MMKKVLNFIAITTVITMATISYCQEDPVDRTKALKMAIARNAIVINKDYEIKKVAAEIDFIKDYIARNAIVINNKDYKIKKVAAEIDFIKDYIESRKRFLKGYEEHILENTREEDMHMNQKAFILAHKNEIDQREAELLKQKSEKKEKHPYGIVECEKILTEKKDLLAELLKQKSEEEKHPYGIVE
jgi:hypothetical protein